MADAGGTPQGWTDEARAALDAFEEKYGVETVSIEHHERWVKENDTLRAQLREATDKLRHPELGDVSGYIEHLEARAERAWEALRGLLRFSPKPEQVLDPTEEYKLAYDSARRALAPQEHVTTEHPEGWKDG